MKRSIKSFATGIGVVSLGSLAGTAQAQDAGSLFGIKDLGSGYAFAAALGEGKCGEAKGGNLNKTAGKPSAPAASGTTDKQKEHKCGNGKDNKKESQPALKKEEQDPKSRK